MIIGVDADGVLVNMHELIHSEGPVPEPVSWVTLSTVR